MADFCLDCFKKFEPNANEDNTILSDYLDFCEGCRKMKQVVFEFNENKKPMQIVNSIQDDFCGVPCDFMQDTIKSQAAEIERLKEKIERLTSKCDDCAGCTSWKCDCSNIEIQAYEKFAEKYKDQIKNYTGMFTDFGFMVNLEAVLNAVDFIRDKLVGENNDQM